MSSAGLLHVDDEQCDVVVAGCALRGVVDEVVGEGLRGFARGSCEMHGEVSDGVLDVHAGGFDESVGVESKHGAGWQGDLGGLVVGGWIDAEYEPGRQVEDLGVPVGVEQEWWG